MPGTRTRAHPVKNVVAGYSSAAVTAAQNLVEIIVPFFTRIGAIAAYAETAGTGAGNTVLDVLLNGTSIWATAADRPTLLATSTGEFANPTPTTRFAAAGDRIRLQVASISTTGHARLMLSVCLEAPG